MVRLVGIESLYTDWCAFLPTQMCGNHALSIFLTEHLSDPIRGAAKKVTELVLLMATEKTMISN